MNGTSPTSPCSSEADPPPTQSPRSWLTPAWLCLLLVVLYLASLGPLIWLEGRGVLGSSFLQTIFETIYFPLFYIHEHSDFFGEHPVGMAYAWYVGLWIR